MTCIIIANHLPFAAVILWLTVYRFWVVIQNCVHWKLNSLPHHKSKKRQALLSNFESRGMSEQELVSVITS